MSEAEANEIRSQRGARETSRPRSARSSEAGAQGPNFLESTSDFTGTRETFVSPRPVPTSKLKIPQGGRVRGTERSDVRVVPFLSAIAFYRRQRGREENESKRMADERK